MPLDKLAGSMVGTFPRRVVTISDRKNNEFIVAQKESRNGGLLFETDEQVKYHVDRFRSEAAANDLISSLHSDFQIDCSSDDGETYECSVIANDELPYQKMRLANPYNIAEEYKSDDPMIIRDAVLKIHNPQEKFLLTLPDLAEDNITPLFKFFDTLMSVDVQSAHELAAPHPILDRQSFSRISNTFDLMRSQLQAQLLAVFSSDDPQGEAMRQFHGKYKPIFDASSLEKSKFIDYFTELYIKLVSFNHLYDKEES